MKDLRMRLLIVAVCLQITVVQAQTLQGIWTVEQITIEKNTNSRVDTTVYHSAAEVTGTILCPDEWEINQDSIVWRYFRGGEAIFAYTLDGDQLTLNTVGAIHPYQYSMSGGKLILTIRYNVNNPPIHMDEKWIITLSK